MMEEFAANFHFLRPWLLLLLAIPLFWYGRYFKGINNQSSWEKVCDKRLLDFLLIKGSSHQRKAIAVLGLLAFLSGIIAAAGPTWKKIEIPALTPQNPVMLLLNMSSDMEQNDVTPTRLERAKYKISDLLPLLDSVQVGLIVYSSEPFLISPITDDREIIKNLLPAINFDIMPENGDRLDRALGLAVEKLKNAGYKEANIIIFTPDVGQRFDLALEAAKKARQQGYIVNVLGVNSEEAEKLKLIAQAGGGIEVKLSGTDNDIKKLADKINLSVSDLRKSENLQSIWLDYGYYLVILPLLFSLYFFRKGILVLLFIIGLSHNAEAGFFLNNDQEGLKAFNAGDFETAQTKFKDAKWQAATDYRLGNYDKALSNYAKFNDETGLYNQGNALAKGGKISEAIKKYEDVLKLNPNHEDAKFNLEYLKKQQEQQQQQNRQQNQNNQNEDDNKQQEQNQQQQQNPQEQQSQDQQQNQSEQNQEQDKNQQQEQNQQNNEQNSSADENDSQDEQENNNEQQEESQPNQEQESGQSAEQGKSPQELQKGDDETKYDEEIQAKAQQYREIPEDTGGLLKAFILKEYRRNRYQE